MFSGADGVIADSERSPQMWSANDWRSVQQRIQERKPDGMCLHAACHLADDARALGREPRVGIAPQGARLLIASQFGKLARACDGSSQCLTFGLQFPCSQRPAERQQLGATCEYPQEAVCEAIGQRIAPELALQLIECDVPDE